MRKSGWAAAAGLVSAVLLLTACGGSSSNSNATGGSTSGGATPSTSAAGTNSPNSGGSGASPSVSGSMSSPPPGTVYFTVQKSADGYILAEKSKPVYEYTGDTAGMAGKCTGACATAWPPVMAQNPQVSAGFNIPGTFGEISGQATYNGHPLYTYAGAKDLSVHPGGQWKLVPMSKSYIKNS